jgi:hypothetical protein
LGHLCHSCNIPLLPLDSITATTLYLCPPNVSGPERKQHSMDLYFKLVSNGILVRCLQTTAWLTMFAVRADGYGLLYELIFNAIPPLSVTVSTFPTWEKYPDVYRLVAACMDYFQVDSTSHSNQRQAPRPQSMLYLSAIKDNSLEASIRMLKDRLFNSEHDHSIPPDLLLTSLPRILRPLDPSAPRDTADDFSGQLNAFTRRPRDSQDSTRPRHDDRRGGTAHHKFARNRTNSQCHACGQFGHDKTSCVHTANFVTAQAWCLANTAEATILSTAWKRAQATNPVLLLAYLSLLTTRA